jgi:hypothetical protein
MHVMSEYIDTTNIWCEAVKHKVVILFVTHETLLCGAYITTGNASFLRQHREHNLKLNAVPKKAF